MEDEADSAGSTPDPAEAVKRAFASGRAYAEAEIERQKLRAGLAVAGARDAAMLGGIALVLLLATLPALLVGLILALAPAVGIWAAVGTVIGGALLVILVLVLAMRARIRHMIEAIKP